MLTGCHPPGRGAAQFSAGRAAVRLRYPLELLPKSLCKGPLAGRGSQLCGRHTCVPTCFLSKHFPTPPPF